MSEITIELDKIEANVRLHMNNAQASLASQSTKYASSGIISAAIVVSLAELVLTSVEHQDGQSRRFQGYYEQSLKLLNAYWEDFGLVLLKRTGSDQQVMARVEPTQPSKPTIKQAVGKRGGYRYIAPEVRDEIKRTLLSGVPTGTTKTDWYEVIAKANGVSTTFVYGVAAKLNGQLA